MRILHTMLRVGDLQRSVRFYTEVLGMKLLRTTDRPEQKYKLAFVGYDTEERSAVLELTYNHGVGRYELGGASGHAATEVDDLRKDLRRGEDEGRQGDARAGAGEGRHQHDRLRRGPRRLQDRAHRKARVVLGREVLGPQARIDPQRREIDFRQGIAQRLAPRRKRAPQELLVDFQNP